MYKHLLKKSSIFLLTGAYILTLSLPAYAGSNRQEQSGYFDYIDADSNGSSAPDSFDSVFDGLQDSLDGNSWEEGNNSCSKPGAVTGEVGSNQHGAGSDSSFGNSESNSSSSGRTDSSYAEIIGSTKKEDTENTITTITPGDSSETIGTVPGKSDSSSGSSTTQTPNNDSGNTESGNAPEESPLPAIRDLLNLTPKELYDMQFADSQLQKETNNTYTGPNTGYESNNGQNDATYGGHVTAQDGNVYWLISQDEFKNAYRDDDGNFIIDTSTGNTITITLEKVPGSEDKWTVKDFNVSHIDWEESEETEEYGWETVREEELYCYWEWKNISNPDWKRFYNDRYYPIGGTVEASKTSSSSIKWTLGHGAYDNGTWSIQMKPRIRLYQEKEVTGTRTVSNGDGTYSTETVTKIKERQKDIWGDYVYYEVTIPLICNTCPEITICLSDEGACDCDGLYTTCGNEGDSAVNYSIDHRSALTY